MATPTFESELLEQLQQLPVEQQHQVLEFARSLVNPPGRGVPGKVLLQFAGTIDAEDLALMSQAIEEGCENIDLNEW